MMGSAYFTTQYLQSVLDMSTLRAALWSVAPSLAIGAAAPTATAVAQKVNRAYVIAAGFVIGAAGYALLALAGTDSLWTVLAGAAVIGMGIVTVMALVSDMALASAPAEKAGSAASLLETGQEFGGALGMAVLGSIGTAVYRSDLPASAPAAARETLGAAVAGTDRALAGLAQQAFVHGMQYAAVGGTLILVIAAVLAAGMLRGPAAAAKAAAQAQGAEGDGSEVAPARISEPAM